MLDCRFKATSLQSLKYLFEISPIYTDQEFRFKFSSYALAWSKSKFFLFRCTLLKSLSLVERYVFAWHTSCVLAAPSHNDALHKHCPLDDLPSVCQCTCTQLAIQAQPIEALNIYTYIYLFCSSTNAYQRLSKL